MRLPAFEMQQKSFKLKFFQIAILADCNSCRLSGSFLCTTAIHRLTFVSLCRILMDSLLSKLHCLSFPRPRIKKLNLPYREKSTKSSTNHSQRTILSGPNHANLDPVGFGIRQTGEVNAQHSGLIRRSASSLFT